MTQHVKEFIESTIDLIENEKYHEAFTIWYLHYSNAADGKSDYQHLEELFQIFNSIGIDLYNKSESARKEIIAEYMYDYIDDVLTNDPDVQEITLPDVVKHLNSKLEVRLITLNELFKEVSTKLSPTHDIIRLPFNIRRRK